MSHGPPFTNERIFLVMILKSGVLQSFTRGFIWLEIYAYFPMAEHYKLYSYSDCHHLKNSDPIPEITFTHPDR